MRGAGLPHRSPDRQAAPVHRFVDRGDGMRLWAEDLRPPDPPTGPADRGPLLLVAPANRSGATWPDAFVEPLTQRHRVLRYDHRDTGRSGRSEDPGGYGLPELAADALAVLDAFEVDRAHVVGVGLGGLITQLLLLDHPHRLRTAVLASAPALGASADPDLPRPGSAVLRLWAEADDPRDDGGELDWRVEQSRLLSGAGAGCDAGAARALEERALAHSGSAEPETAHLHLDPCDLDRAAELAGVEVPTLVIEAPADPVHPPPHPAHLAAALGDAPLVRIAGMGHGVDPSVAAAVAAAVLAHTG